MGWGFAGHSWRASTAVFAVAALLSALAIVIARAPNEMAVVWPANAPTVALLCMVAPARWPAILAAHLAGVLLGDAIAGVPATMILALGPLNILEIALAAWLLRRHGAAEQALSTPATIARFTLLAAVATPLAIGLVAGLAVWVIGGDPIASALRWPISHGLGMIIAFPLALKVVRGRLSRTAVAERGGWFRVAGSFALVFVVTFASFAQQHLPLLFLPMVPLLLASLWLGRMGAALGVVALALGAAAARVLFGAGPLAFTGDLSAAGQLQFAAFYIGALFATALPVAAVIEQRDSLRALLARSEAHFRALAEASSDAFVTLTADGHIRYASSALRHLGGWQPEMLTGLPGKILVHPDHHTRVDAVHRAALERPDKVFRVEYLALSDLGTGEVWIESTMRAFQDPSDPLTAVLCVSRDLSARKRREDELRHAADTDALTALPNRAAFRRAAEGVFRRGEAGTLALLDLDHFKGINDRHGHAAGDSALRAVAALLRDAVRGEDIVARYGGEEFVILFRHLPLAEAERAADRIAARLARAPIEAGNVSLLLTTSIGVAGFGPDSALDDVLERADASLYAAKRAGRNRVMAAA